MDRAGFFRFITVRHFSEAPAALPAQLHEDSHPKTQQAVLPHPGSVKRYHRIRLLTGLIHSALVFALTLVALATGITRIVEQAVREVFSNEYAVLLGFGAVIGTAEGILSLPLRYYVGFRLEHAYGLSNQSLPAWVWERTKGVLVAAPMTALVFVTLLYCIRTFGSLWWLPVSVVLFVFSTLFARIAPVLIFPLFYRFKPLEEGPLRERILALCGRVGVRIKGIFVFNMSKTTRKANAAFTGVGKSKRIILGDTLISNCTDDEIESVFAHELGHYRLNHIWTMIALGTVSTFVGLYLAASLYEVSLSWFGFLSRDTIAALPLLGLWLGVYSLVTSPMTNAVSRAHEREADSFSVRTVGNREALIGALRKLGTINLADVEPHPLVEFLFYSHPSLAKRIADVKTMADR